MCISTLLPLKKISKNVLRYETGLKVFMPFQSKEKSVYSYYRGKNKISTLTNDKTKTLRTLPIGEWIIDKNKTILCDFYDEKYKTGFHIYVDSKRKIDHHFYTGGVCDIYKVYFKNIVAYGDDIGFNVVVAREMFICSFDERFLNLPAYLK